MRSNVAGCLATISFLVLATLGSASAQPTEQKNIYERYRAAQQIGNFREALKEAQQLERLARLHSATQPGYYAEVLELLGEAQMALGYYDDAQQNFKEALGILEHVPGSIEKVPWATGLLGEAYRRAGRNREASPLLRSALEMWQAAEGGHLLKISLGFNTLGRIAFRTREDNAAE